MRITIATVLTLVRLFLILPILVLITIPLPFVAFVLLAVALATDILDGRIARATKTITRLGTFLDHFADKVLVHLVLLVFVALHHLSWVAFAIFLLRDFLVLGIRHLATQRGKEIGSMWLGKVKFVGQSVLLLVLVATLAYPVAWLSLVSTIVLWVAVALAVASGAQIIVVGLPALRD